ncbi:MAG: glycine betaine ABC transporter substrate-binding protein [Pseudomonadota bacterium]
MSNKTRTGSFAKSITKALGGALLASSLVLAGCGDQDAPTLRVGSKDFTESELLAELMALMAESEGIVVQRAIPYGSAAVTFEGLKQDKLDVYPEYNGTGLVFLGQAPLANGDESFERVKKLYGELGYDWRGRFGFSNDYVLVTRPETAEKHDLKDISDLGSLGAVDIATDVTFTQRPLDGLGAMLRRYGLSSGRVLSYPLAEGGKDKIMQALLDGEVTVAEMFRTDPQIEAFDLVVLKDDLQFFPAYQAAPLVRDSAMKRFPTLSAAMARLEDKISADQMRTMISEVEFNGRTVGAVALDFLVDQGLLDATAATESGGGGGQPLVVAIGPLDSLTGPAGKAVRAARAVFPKRAIKVLRTPDPLNQVTEGKARLAVAGVDAFYTLEGDKAALTSSDEALGVVGYRMAHIVTRDSSLTSLSDVKKLGVGPAGSASDHVARMVLAGIGASGVDVVPGDFNNVKAYFEAISIGGVDAILLMLPVGDITMHDLMEDGNYRMLPIEGWNEGTAPLSFSFLRPAKIPAGSYPGQSGAVETLSTQIVLAGPSGQREAFGAQGPGTTGTASTQPIPATTIHELAEALGSVENVDPAAPTAAALQPALEEGPQPLVADAATSIVNLAVAIFLAYLVYLLVARKPKR